MNQIDLHGRVAVVTGGARGIGLAIARRLLMSGAGCSLWDIDTAALGAVDEALGHLGDTDVAKISVNITDPTAVAEAAAATAERFGKIDLLVNNAGIAGVSKKLWECSVAEWRQVIELDLMAVFYCCRTIVPIMLRSGYGRIVNIASIAGKEGNPNASHYSAAKAGVIGLTKSLGKELAQSRVAVNCITPAVIETDILKQVSEEHRRYMLSKVPMGRAGTAEEVAALVAWLCSEECSFTTGGVFDISGGRATY